MEAVKIQTTFQKEGKRSAPRYIKRTVDTETGETYVIEAKTYLDKEVINNQIIYFIYDNKQVLFKEAYFYLNHVCSAMSENTRYQKACALRLLYTFLILEPSQDLHRLNLESLKKFIYFLKEVTGDKCSVRDNKTVNAILSNIAPMFDGDSAPMTWHAITEKKSELVSSLSDGELKINYYKERNVNYLREGNAKNKYVPEYIRAAEFVILMQIVQNHHDVQGEILIRLMYSTGVRIGECLGLTIEDIQATEESNGTIYQIIVRNRTTDSKRQCAKTKPKIKDKREYKTVTYENDTDHIIIDIGLYYKIMEYIEESHQRAMALPNNKYRNSLADSVEPSDFENHYVFINEKGAKLLPKNWNDRLRSYFVEAGLHIDQGKKKYGLNHRFRHGFAMLFKEINQPKMGDAFLIELKKLMRHKKLSSTMVYLRDTREAEIQLKMDFIEDLYNKFPELRYANR